jgi:hypothetical protein
MMYQLRGSFDTLQVIDDIKVPNGQRGKAEWSEPLTKDYPKFGQGRSNTSNNKQPYSAE